MISSKILSTALQDLHSITGTDLLLLSRENAVVANYYPDLSVSSSAVRDFLTSAADTMEVQGNLFIRIGGEDRTDFILIAGGKNRDTTARIAASELRHLLLASQERTDRNRFIQNILLDNLLPVDIRENAKKMKIKEETPRAVYLVETSEPNSEIALRTLQAIYSSPAAGSFVTSTDSTHIAVVCEVPAAADGTGLAKTAYTLADMLNTEAMISVHVSYGTPVGLLSHLSQSYKEAQLAMEVGRIFYPDRHVISYGKLGIGRLIYQLPHSLCHLFLKETFDHNIFEDLDEETLSTIRHFFNNNLNISETARQLYIHRNTLVYRLEKLQKLTGLDIRKFDEAMTFKIAMMVHDYLESTPG